MKNYSGKTINQYYLAKDLGQGGMVVVYKAFDNALNRDVVVKMVRIEDLDGTKRTDILQRFTPLGNSLLQLNHPHIAPVLDHGFFEGVPYLVAEYLPGGTLKQRMRNKLSLKAAIQVLRPITDALIYAHHHGVLHQDFKPSNVLFQNQGKRPLLTDLGIASLFTDSVFAPDLFELGFGTPAYMAPEQWRGLATEQSDVYSVGIVFYEMLTGKIANKTETPLAAAFKQNEGLIPDPTDMVTGLSSEVQHFFFKCLALEPVNRFQSMEEMKIAMERLEGTTDDRQTGGIQVEHFQAIEPGFKQASNVSKSGYEPTQIRQIQEDPTQQVSPQPSREPLQPTHPKASMQPFIQEGFHPSQKPDYIQPRVAPQPTEPTLPPIQLQQKPTRAKPHPQAAPLLKQNPPLQVFHRNPWVTALVLGLAIGLSHWIGAVFTENTNFFQRDWFSDLFGCTLTWSVAGLAIYFYFTQTTRQKLYPLGLIGFVLAGVIPTMIERLVRFPYNAWLHDIVLWLFLGFGIGMMFHGPEKVQSSQGLALIGGWTIAGALSGLALLVFSSFNPLIDEVPLYLRAIQGLLLGLILALAVFDSFQEHFKHDQYGLIKLVASFSVACIGALLLRFGVENELVASGISWLLMTVIILAGIAWATFQAAVPKNLSSSIGTNTPENRNHK
jgi:serine/threonine protein kinase